MGNLQKKSLDKLSFSFISMSNCTSEFIRLAEYFSSMHTNFVQYLFVLVRCIFLLKKEEIKKKKKVISKRWIVLKGPNTQYTAGERKFSVFNGQLHQRQYPVYQ